jgi:hypothetical protein
LLITSPVGVSPEPLLDQRNVLLAPPLAAGAVAGKDVAAPEEHDLALPVREDAIMLETQKPSGCGTT